MGDGKLEELPIVDALIPDVESIGDRVRVEAD